MPVVSKAQFRFFQWLLHRKGSSKKQRQVSEEMLHATADYHKLPAFRHRKGRKLG